MDNPRDPVSFPAPLVLVVDDSAINQDIMEALLTRLGYRVHCAASGPEALEWLSQEFADLIFMDFHMPHMDGLQVTTEIRRREGAVRHTPIIGLTAGDEDHSKRECLNSGMDDVLIKPVLGDLLKSTLAKWVTSVDAHVLTDLQEALGGGASKLYQEAVATFLNEGELHLRALEKAVSNRDPETIAHEAHLLKGASGYFGAMAVQNLCHRIESLARAIEIDDLSRILQSLRIEFVRVQKTLSEETIHEPA